MKNIKVYLAIFTIIISLILSFSVFNNKDKDLIQPEKLKKQCGLDTNCYKNTFERELKTMGIEKTIKLMNETSSLTNGFYNSCHKMAHEMGETAYGIYGVSALKKHDNSCEWGFGHGVMVAASSDLSVETFSKYFADFCTTDAQPLGCFHGLGHTLGEKRVSSIEADSSCFTLSFKYDQSKSETRKLETKTGYGVCIEGWVMQQLHDPMWANYINYKDVKEFCKGISRKEGVDVCIGMGLRSFLDNGDNKANRVEMLTYFKNFCLTIGNFMYYECGRYLGEAADEVFVPGVKYDKKNVSNGLEKTCSGIILESCTLSFINAQIGRSSNNIEVIRETCNLLTFKKKNYCLYAIKSGKV